MDLSFGCLSYFVSNRVCFMAEEHEQNVNLMMVKTRRAWGVITFYHSFVDMVERGGSDIAIA
jgi:hypothetical protein